MSTERKWWDQNKVIQNLLVSIDNSLWEFRKTPNLEQVLPRIFAVNGPQLHYFVRYKALALFEHEFLDESYVSQSVYVSLEATNRQMFEWREWGFKRGCESDDREVRRSILQEIVKGARIGPNAEELIGEELFFPELCEIPAH